MRWASLTGGTDSAKVLWIVAILALLYSTRITSCADQPCKRQSGSREGDYEGMWFPDSRVGGSTALKLGLRVRQEGEGPSCMGCYDDCDDETYGICSDVHYITLENPDLGAQTSLAPDDPRWSPSSDSGLHREVGALPMSALHGVWPDGPREGDSIVRVEFRGQWTPSGIDGELILVGRDKGFSVPDWIREKNPSRLTTCDSKCSETFSELCRLGLAPPPAEASSCDELKKRDCPQPCVRPDCKSGLVGDGYLHRRGSRRQQGPERPIRQTSTAHPQAQTVDRPTQRPKPRLAVTCDARCRDAAVAFCKNRVESYRRDLSACVRIMAPETADGLECPEECVVPLCEQFSGECPADCAEECGYPENALKCGGRGKDRVPCPPPPEQRCYTESTGWTYCPICTLKCQDSCP